MASSSKSSHYWTEEETDFMLLKLKEYNIARCLDGRKKRNGALFKLVSGSLSEAGFCRTAEQVRVRWKNMKSLYHTVQRHNRQGLEPKSCPHFRILHELLGDLPTAQASSRTYSRGPEEDGEDGEEEERGAVAESCEDVPELSSLESENEAETPSRRVPQPTETSSPNSPSAESTPNRVQSPGVYHDRYLKNENSKTHRQNIRHRENHKLNTDVSTTATVSSSKSSHYWTEEETDFMLLKLKECNIARCLDGRKKRNGALFKLVSGSLSEAGFCRTAEQVRVRWKNMKSLYHTVQRHNRQGLDPKSCPHFRILHELLGDPQTSSRTSSRTTSRGPEGEDGERGCEPNGDMPELSSLESEDEADTLSHQYVLQPTDSSPPNSPSPEPPPRRVQSPGVSHDLYFDQREKENFEVRMPRENPEKLMRLMSKINALGFQPILFLAKTSQTGQVKGDLIHFMQPEKRNVEILQNMHKLYESLIGGQSSSTSTKPEIKTELKVPQDADPTVVSDPTPQVLFSAPSTVSSTPPPAGTTPSSYYIVPAPQPTGPAPGTALTPYYVIPAAPPTGPTPVPLPTSYHFLPAPQPDPGPSPVPAPTPYYLFPALQPAGATPVPAPMSFMVPAPQNSI